MIYNPRDKPAIAQIEQMTGLNVVPFLAAEMPIRRAHLLYRGNILDLLERSAAEAAGPATRAGVDRTAAELGSAHPGVCGRRAGVGHPHRALRARDAGALPDRRRAEGGPERGPRGPCLARGPGEDLVGDADRRAAGAAGRTPRARPCRAPDGYPGIVDPDGPGEKLVLRLRQGGRVRGPGGARPRVVGLRHGAREPASPLRDDP